MQLTQGAHCRPVIPKPLTSVEGEAIAGRGRISKQTRQSHMCSDSNWNCLGSLEGRMTVSAYNN
jgi:hypothetical protein